MANLISLTYDQKSCYQTYQGSRDKCDVSYGQDYQDWMCKEDNSGFVNKYYCSKLDYNFFKLGPSSSGNEPLVKANWVSDRNSTVIAVYNLDYIDKIDQVNNIILKYGPESEIYKQAMFNLSSKSTRELTKSNLTCQPDNDKLPYDCSIIKSTSSTGNYVRKWLNNQSQQDKDSIISNYCLGKNTTECACVNRSMDPIYKQIKPANDINDSCWYVPCSSGNLNYLLKSDVIDQKCPTNVCSQIYNFINDNNVSMDAVKNSINCKFDASDHHENTIPEPPTAPALHPGNYKIWLYAALVIIIALIIFVVLK